MKKIIFSLLLLPIGLYAQQVRHVKGMKDLRLGGGLTKLGTYGNLGFGYNLSSKVNIGADLLYEMADYQGLKFNSVFLLAGVTYSPYNINETLYFNIHAGVIPSYAFIADTKGLKEGTKQSGLNVGVYVGPELDLYVFNRVILNAYFKQSYLPLAYMGKAVFFLGGGLKFSIN